MTPSLWREHEGLKYKRRLSRSVGLPRHQMITYIDFLSVANFFLRAFSLSDRYYGVRKESSCDQCSRLGKNQMYQKDADAIRCPNVCNGWKGDAQRA